MNLFPVVTCDLFNRSEPNEMVLFPQTVLDILARGGSVRLSAQGWFPDVMGQLARAAAAGGGYVEFVVGDAVLFPQTLNDVTSAGNGHVRWDFVSKVQD